VGTVDEGADATSFEHENEALDREDHAAATSDVADEGDSCAWCDCGKNGVDDGFRTWAGKGKARCDELGASTLSGGACVIYARGIFMAGNKDFIAGCKADVGKDGGHADGGVSDGGDEVWLAMNERGEGFAGAVHTRSEFFNKEANRLGFESVLDLGLRVADEGWAAAEGAMVKEADVGIKAPILCKGRRAGKGE